MAKFNYKKWVTEIKLREQEEKEMTKDAQTLSDHPLLDKINTKDEWVDVMKALMDH